MIGLAAFHVEFRTSRTTQKFLGFLKKLFSADISIDYVNRPDSTSEWLYIKRLLQGGSHGVQIPSRLNLPYVASDSPPLQNLKYEPWRKPRRWAPLTRDTQKSIFSEYNKDLTFFKLV